MPARRNSCAAVSVRHTVTGRKDIYAGYPAASAYLASAVVLQPIKAVEFIAQLETLIAQGQREQALRLFILQGAGVNLQELKVRFS